MTTQRQREIVIEFERVHTIRKRTKTRLIYCPPCAAETDTVTLVEAAELFEITRDNLFRFIKQTDCHFHDRDGGEIHLCVPSMLENMLRKNEISRLAAKGESK